MYVFLGGLSQLQRDLSSDHSIITSVLRNRRPDQHYITRQLHYMVIKEAAGYKRKSNNFERAGGRSLIVQVKNKQNETKT